MTTWNNKVVVVAGGSSGLGLRIANAFHSRGAKIAILARNLNRIEEVVSRLNGVRPESASGFSVDLVDEAGLNEVASEIAMGLGAVFAWINAAGQSTRTSFADAKLDQYRELMDQNFFTSVNGSLTAIKLMKSNGGHLVNIGSLASKTAWPHVAPYVASKHALAGFANQLRLEGPESIHYLFVCTGPIKSDQKDRYQANSRNLPSGAAKPGAGAPVKAIDPDWLAEKIVAACESEKTELIVPFKSRLLFIVSQIWPGLGDRLIRKYR